VGIELYENYAQIAQKRCHVAHLLRLQHEAENPLPPGEEFIGGSVNKAMLGVVSGNLVLVL
jgi:hypothetical protein